LWSFVGWLPRVSSYFWATRRNTPWHLLWPSLLPLDDKSSPSFLIPFGILLERPSISVRSMERQSWFNLVPLSVWVQLLGVFQSPAFPLEAYSISCLKSSFLLFGCGGAGTLCDPSPCHNFFDSFATALLPACLFKTARSWEAPLSSRLSRASSTRKVPQAGTSLSMRTASITPPTCDSLQQRGALGSPAFPLPVTGVLRSWSLWAHWSGFSVSLLQFSSSGTRRSFLVLAFFLGT